VDQLVYVRSGAAVVVTVPATDLDPDGDLISVSSFTQGVAGSVSLRANKMAFVYHQSGNLTGEDHFTYTLSDPFGLSTTATVRVLPMAAVKGAYDGLIQVISSDPAPADSTTSGRLRLTVAPTGAFTANLIYRGVQRVWTGTFDNSGHYTTTVKISSGETVTLNLFIDGAEQANQVTGSVLDGDTAATLTLGRSRFNARTFPAPEVGIYTVLITPDASDGPTGYGYARAIVSKGGSVTMKGRLGDGTIFSFGAPLGVDGVFPIYVNLPHGRRHLPGFLLGEATFADLPGQSDFSASVTFYQPSTADNSEISVQQELEGARYLAPKRGEPVFALPDVSGAADFDFSTDDNDIPVTLGDNNGVTVIGMNDLRLQVTLHPATGLFSGSYRDEGGGAAARHSFAGALLQKRRMGAGLTLGGDSGPVTLVAPAPAGSTD
jgi:hypothetical protein